MMIEGSASPYRVIAPMTYETAAELMDRGTALLSGEAVIFDLSSVEDADSSALSVILAWQRASKGRLTITNLPPDVRSLATLYGIDKFLAQ